MCGIAGSTRADVAVLAAMAARLAHRGPDGHGVWRDEAAGAGLAHTRLAIIDLSDGGRQPMVSPCGRWAVAFNGEIYNYRELRAGLEARGETFASSSDTEVLLRLLVRDGLAALPKLVGMFALGLWDRERRQLTLVRDRLGVKPLVWAHLPDGTLAFASEIDALAAHPGIDLSLDRAALSGYLACLYVPAPRTMHAGIRKLAPGHWLTWRDGAVETGCWWRPAFVGGRQPSLDEAVEELTPLLRDAVAARLVADVEVGCFLSGGVDSSVIAALMARERAAAGAPPPRTFTMTFDEAAYDERDSAARVARHIGARHTELPASPAAAGFLDDMVRRFGEPFGNPTALLVHDLAQAARVHVKVALVGDAGDEVFGGYPRYAGGALAERYLRLVPGKLRAAAAAAAGLIPESSRGRHAWRRAREFLAAGTLPAAEGYAAWVEYFSPQERQALLGLAAPPVRPVAALMRAAPSDDIRDAMQQTDLLSFLPGNILAYGDAMSMAAGLELRTPLLDHRLVEAVGRLAPGLRFAHGKKTLLKAVARRLLPAAIVDRPKLGFNPPMGVWLKGELAPLLAERLTRERMAALGLDWPPVARLLEEQRAGRRDHALKLWALLVAEAWLRQQGESGRCGHETGAAFR